MKKLTIIILSIISVFGLWILWFFVTFATSFNSVTLSYHLKADTDYSANLDNLAQCLNDTTYWQYYRCHLPHNKCSVGFRYSCNSGRIFINNIRFDGEDPLKVSHSITDINLFNLIEIEDEFNTLLNENIPSGVRRFYPDIIVTTNYIVWENYKYYVLIALLLFPAYLIYQEISLRMRKR